MTWLMPVFKGITYQKYYLFPLTEQYYTLCTSSNNDFTSQNLLPKMRVKAHQDILAFSKTTRQIKT